MRGSMKQIAFECDECGERWPNYQEYAHCPRCRIPCRSSLGDTILNAGEARKLRSQVIFEREYLLLEEKRERLGKATPEELGRLEARELAKAWREAVEVLRQ